jgi:hypothetical protein
MKRTIIGLGLIAGLLTTAAPALAAEGDPAGGCQPGTGDAVGATGIGAWQLLSQAEYAELLKATFEEPYPGAAEERAGVTYAFCDKNDDGYACVLKQTFPSNAAGYTYSLLVEDNHFPDGG